MSATKANQRSLWQQVKALPERIKEIISGLFLLHVVACAFVCMGFLCGVEEDVRGSTPAWWELPAIISGLLALCVIEVSFIIAVVFVWPRVKEVFRR